MAASPASPPASGANQNQGGGKGKDRRSSFNIIDRGGADPRGSPEKRHRNQDQDRDRDQDWDGGSGKRHRNDGPPDGALMGTPPFSLCIHAHIQCSS